MSVNVEELRYVFTTDTTQFNNSLNQVNGQVDKLGQGFSTAMKAAQLIGFTALSVKVMEFGKSCIETYANIQALTMGMTALMGSSSKAAAELEKLRALARNPGIGFEAAVKGALRLQGVGMSADKARESIKQFGNALSMFGGGPLELGEVETSISQILSKGTIEAREIKEIALRIPQIRNIMKQEFGTADTMALQKSGITPEAFIDRLVMALSKLPRVGDNVKNALINMSDSWDQFKEKLADSVAPQIENIIKSLSNLIDVLKALPSGVQAAGAGLLALIAGGGPLLGVIGLLSNVSAIKGATIATSSNTGTTGTFLKQRMLDVLSHGTQISAAQENILDSFKPKMVNGVKTIAIDLKDTEKAHYAIQQFAELKKGADSNEQSLRKVKAAIDMTAGGFGKLTIIQRVSEYFNNLVYSIGNFLTANATLLVVIGAVSLALYGMSRIRLWAVGDEDKIEQRTKHLKENANAAESAATAMMDYIKAGSVNNPETKSKLGVSHNTQNKISRLEHEKEFLNKDMDRGNYNKFWTDKIRLLDVNKELKDLYIDKENQANDLTKSGKITQKQYAANIASAQSEFNAAKEAGSLAGQYAGEAKIEYWKNYQTNYIEKGKNSGYNLNLALERNKATLDKKLQQSLGIGEQEQRNINQPVHQAHLQSMLSNTNPNDSYTKALTQAQMDRDNSIASALERSLENGEYKNNNKVRDALVKAANDKYNAAIRDASKAEYWKKMHNVMSEDQGYANRILSSYSSYSSSMQSGIDIGKERYNDLTTENKTGAQFSRMSGISLGMINKNTQAKMVSGNTQALSEYKQSMASLLELEANGENITQRKIALEEKYQQAVKDSALNANNYRKQETNQLIEMGKQRTDTIKAEITSELDRQRAMAGFGSITSAYENASKLGQQNKILDPTKHFDMLSKTKEYNGANDQVTELKKIVSGINSLILGIQGVGTYQP